MTKFKVLALCATLIMATAGLAIACDKGSSSASAETASAEVASAGCASSAAVKTAGAGCASSAAVKTAGAGCASGAAAQTAGAGCASGAGVTEQTVQVETVRMPSGSMAVFYNGTNAETVAFLQSKANAGCSGFVCDMAKSMAADTNVTTEIAATDKGVMILVTASDAAAVDPYEEKYAALTAAPAQADGE